jgi:glutathione S-transferase
VALDELGLEYRHEPLRPVAGSADRERLLALNPNGHIPVLAALGDWLARCVARPSWQRVAELP